MFFITPPSCGYDPLEQRVADLEGVQMLRSYKTAARGLALPSLTLLVVSTACAQAWTTLDAAPTGIAAPAAK
jgi:hypothetical protein